jgi:hypothetical protein
MKIYEKLSLDSFSNDIYLPMKIIKWIIF